MILILAINIRREARVSRWKFISRSRIHDTSEPEPGTHDARLGKQELPSAHCRGCIAHFNARFFV